MASARDGDGPRAFPLRYARDVHEAVLRSAQAELRSAAAHIQVLVRDALRARAAGRKSPPPGASGGERHVMTLRWPPAFHAEALASAEADRRTLNAHAEVLVRESLAARGVRVGSAKVPDGKQG